MGMTWKSVFELCSHHFSSSHLDLTEAGKSSFHITCPHPSPRIQLYLILSGKRSQVNKNNNFKITKGKQARISVRGDALKSEKNWNLFSSWFLPTVQVFLHMDKEWKFAPRLESNCAVTTVLRESQNLQLHFHNVQWVREACGWKQPTLSSAKLCSLRDLLGHFLTGARQSFGGELWRNAFLLKFSDVKGVKNYQHYESTVFLGKQVSHTIRGRKTRFCCHRPANTWGSLNLLGWKVPSSHFTDCTHSTRVTKRLTQPKTRILTFRIKSNSTTKELKTSWRQPQNFIPSRDFACATRKSFFEQKKNKLGTICFINRQKLPVWTSVQAGSNAFVIWLHWNESQSFNIFPSWCTLTVQMGPEMVIPSDLLLVSPFRIKWADYHCRDKSVISVGLWIYSNYPHSD